jgi:hypothetical protein
LKDEAHLVLAAPPVANRVRLSKVTVRIDGRIVVLAREAVDVEAVHRLAALATSVAVESHGMLGPGGGPAEWHDAAIATATKRKDEAGMKRQQCDARRPSIKGSARGSAL